MEINPMLLNRILEDQKTAWALLEQWIEDGTCYLHDVGGEGHPQDCIRCKTKEYLKPIRAGLANIEANLAKAQELPVIKNPQPVQSEPVSKLSAVISAIDLMPKALLESCKHCGYSEDRHIVGIMEKLCPGDWKPGTRPRFEAREEVKKP